MRHNLIIGKSCGGHLVFMKIRPVMIFSPYQKNTKFFYKVFFIRCLYQYSHLGERDNGLNMMILFGGHFVSRFLISEPQHLGHC